MDAGGKKADLGVSTSLVYDSARKLIWVVDTHSQLHALRFDPKAAGLAELK